MKVKTIKSGKIKENCYVVYDSSDNGLIIDPGENRYEIANYINEKDINVLAIINTHAHYDHIGSVKYFQDSLKIPFYLHSLDERTLKSANLLKIIFEGEKSVSIPTIDIYIDKLEEDFLIDNMLVKVLHTPGHTPGSVSIILENYIFTGDTLMKGFFGRTDLPGGNKHDLVLSLKKLEKLSGNYVIYPGHGPKTILKNELARIRKFYEEIK